LLAVHQSQHDYYYTSQCLEKVTLAAPHYEKPQ